MSDDTFDFDEFMDGYIADLSRALHSLSRESVGLLYKEMLQVMDNGGKVCLLYTSPSPRDVEESRMPSSA